MKNIYLNKWVDTLNNAKTMLENKDFHSYEFLMEEVGNIYNDYKKDCNLTYSCTNFGMANYIFEDALPKLFKKNKKAVGEIIKTIKEDKNLLTQFNFYNAIKKCSSGMDSKNYVNESLEIFSKNADIKTIKESNTKLGKLISKYEIKPEDFISEEDIKLFEACDYVFSHKKKLSNLNEFKTNIDTIVSYTDSHKLDVLSEQKVNLDKVVENFNRKYSSLLNEEEKTFVKEIMDFKTPYNEEKKAKLFNKFKNECIEIVDRLMMESNGEDLESLKSIKEQISNKIYSSDTVVADLAKLLEIRDVLLSD